MEANPSTLASSRLYFHGVQCKIHLVDGVLSPLVCRGRGGGWWWWLDEEAKRGEARERGWVAIGNPRSDQCHAAFIVLQQKGAHQSTGISSRLISRGRCGTNPTLSSPLLFPSPFTLRSFFLPFPLFLHFSSLLPPSLPLAPLRFALLRLSLSRSFHPRARRRGEATPDYTLEVV